MATATTNASAPAVIGSESAARPEAVSVKDLLKDAKRASEILKAMAHEGRLIILCTLYEGDKSVSELESILELRQPAVSQQLARLRGDKLVTTRREGKMIYYSIADEDVRAIIAFLCDLFKNKQKRRNAAH
ncbi:helix-turn-helix transcriptional regulator [Thermopetrobacter sp. TC1]|uniref:ArsR/SmtB family transcription factor n=1 Tax=Thermopetrobacter sp. TC1 TaxID=1495045 RepID=UPI00069194F0|nr:metalloregulator ArsR/SmtB family transcription factor [Thermopetrobacter sp. TC1]